jgi:hypothetical protein
MAELYGTTGIPGTSATVRSGGTTAVGAAFTTTAALVGVMDTDNGDATPGDVYTIESSSEAGTQFGEGSELKEQTDLAYLNGAGLVYAYPVTETETTESFSGSSSGTLAEAPALDPTLHDHLDITAEDTTTSTSVDVVVDPDPTTPADADTIELNPETGNWEADESSDYDITYTHGDYDNGIQETAKLVPRSLGVLTENTSVINDLLTELNSYDVDFDFMHGYAGAPAETTAADYSDNVDDRRQVIVAPSRGYLDSAETNEARTVGAVAGKQAGKPLGDSTTYEDLDGFASLRTAYTNSELATLIDKQVYPIKQGGGVKVIKDMTTSTDTRFERVYASEIVDEVTQISNDIAQQFIGNVNSEDERILLAESHRTSYSQLERDELLEDYFVGVSKGADDFEVDVEIGIDVIGIMDTIDVTVTVGDIITNGGAA